MTIKKRFQKTHKIYVNFSYSVFLKCENMIWILLIYRNAFSLKYNAILNFYKLKILLLYSNNNVIFS